MFLRLTLLCRERGEHNGFTSLLLEDWVFFSVLETLVQNSLTLRVIITLSIIFLYWIFQDLQQLGTMISWRVLKCKYAYKGRSREGWIPYWKGNPSICTRITYTGINFLFCFVLFIRKEIGQCPVMNENILKVLEYKMWKIGETWEMH